MNSDGIPQKISLSSCEYTPIYVIQSDGSTATSYMLTTSCNEPQLPTTNNLKTFYENSGKLEKSLILNNPTYITKSITTAKPVRELPVNNLKLANFLVPKNETKPEIIVNKRVLKPNININGKNGKANLSIVSSVVNVKRDVITRAKPSYLPNLPLLNSSTVAPKIKPKEEKPVINKQTFQLVKVGRTYHSLNQLNNDQVKLLNKALESIDEGESKLKPKYDPVTNTKIIYKVVSPSDLKVVGRDKVVLKQAHKLKKVEVTKHPPTRPPAAVKTRILSPEPEIEETEERDEQVKVTRSGRKVKKPKSIEDKEKSVKAHKVKKKPNLLKCFQCSDEFLNVYQLQRHYEKLPTHIPTNIHTNLFNCFLAILKNGTNTEKCNMFIKQLENFIERLKSALPCLMKNMDGVENIACQISDNVASLLGLNSGEYKLNMDALTCVKDVSGHCVHNPPIPPPIEPVTQKWAQEESNPEPDIEECFRVKPVEQWQVKRVWKHKIQAKEQINSKKSKIEHNDLHIELGSEVPEVTKDQLLPQVEDSKENSPSDNIDLFDKKNPHQFHSTHFDIRSSPMKPSGAVFNKFQIIPEKINEVQFLKPLMFDTPQGNIDANDNSIDFNGILNEFASNNSDSNSNCKTDITFGSKEWPITNSGDEQSHDGFLKPNTLIEPSLLHCKDNLVSKNFNGFENTSDYSRLSSSDITNSISMSQGPAELNFLDSLSSDCLSCPEAEMRNSTIDFQLDLFSFNHS